MCRTQNGADINGIESYSKNIDMIIKENKMYDNYVSCAQKDGRGNICPVTVILPTLAMEAKEWHEAGYNDNIVECFMDILDIALQDAKDMLIERYNYICSQDMNAARFMYENDTMSGYVPEEGIESALRHGTLALG